jgi:hypothetical protein
LSISQLSNDPGDIILMGNLVANAETQLFTSAFLALETQLYEFLAGEPRRLSRARPGGRKGLIECARAIDTIPYPTNLE